MLGRDADAKISEAEFLQALAKLEAEMRAAGGPHLDRANWQNVLCEISKWVKCHQPGGTKGMRRYVPAGQEAQPKQRKQKTVRSDRPPAMMLINVMTHRAKPVQDPAPIVAATAEPAAPEVALSGLVEIDDYYIFPEVIIAEWENRSRCLPAALAYAAQGWTSFPAPRGTKKSHKKAETSNGRNWGATADPDEIRRDYAKWQRANVGIPTGAENGIWVLEADTKQGHGIDGIASLQALIDKHGPLPPTLQARSPSGSLHFYFKWPINKIIRNSASEIGRGIDVRGEGGMVLAPPSVKIPVGVYSWVCNAPIAEAPRWLVDLAADDTSKADRPPPIAAKPYQGFSQYGDDLLARACEAIIAAEAGKRELAVNNWSLILGHYVGGGVLDRDPTIEKLIAAGTQQGAWDDARLREKVTRAVDDGMQEPQDENSLRSTAEINQPYSNNPQLRDNIIALLQQTKQQPEAPKSDAGPQQEAPKSDAEGPPPPPHIMQSSAEFLAGFVPPDYLIEGIIQKRFIYSMTGPTGEGKTSVALLLAFLVAFGISLGGRKIKKGKVLFLAGENPDDVRIRWSRLLEAMNADAKDADVFFVPGSLTLSAPVLRQIIADESKANGPFALIFVDTAAAFFEGDDDNSNAQMLAHAKMLRGLIGLIDGGPTVIAPAHPIKSFSRDNMIPRGGGAFMNELDGNLTCMRIEGTMIAEIHWQGKFRGIDFAAIPFRLEVCKSGKLRDSDGQQLWTVIAHQISDVERDAAEDTSHYRMMELLAVMAELPGVSTTELAKRLEWFTGDGKPYKSLVQRLMHALKDEGKVKKQAGRWTLTKAGARDVKANGPNSEDEDD